MTRGRTPVARRTGQSGATFLELLLVVTLLAVLAAVVVIAVGSSTDRARSASAATERSTIRTALVAYKADTGAYPTAAQGLAVLAAPATHYLDSVPDPAKWAYDPITGDVVGRGKYAFLPGRSTPSINGTVTVFAATSLTSAFNDIKAKLVARNPSLNLVLSFAGSATLKAQINTGASPADVFAAADALNAPNAPYVASTDLFATNTLAIITKPGNPAGVATIADLFAPGLQVVLCQSAQPCGNASNQAFATIGKVRSDLGANLVSETGNVGLVVTGVTTGAPNTVGLVYTTDATAAGGGVATVPVPDANNFVNSYPVYRIATGPNGTGAQQFISYLLGPEGQALLGARGFGHP